MYGFLTMTWRTFSWGRAFWDPKSDWQCSTKQTIQVPNCSKHEKGNRKEPHANDNDDNDDVGQNTHLHPNLPGLLNTTSNHSSPAEVPVLLPTVSRGCMRSRPYQSWRCQGEDLENTIRCQAPGDGIMKLGPGLEVVDFLFFLHGKNGSPGFLEYMFVYYTFHKKEHPRGVKSVPWYNLKNLRRLWQLIGSVGCSVYQLRIASPP